MASTVPSSPATRPSVTPSPASQPTRQVAVGSPGAAVGRRVSAPRPEGGVLDKLKGTFSKPIVLAAALSAGQQYDASREGRPSQDAYEMAMGTEGGQASFAPRPPSYTTSIKRTPEEREGDIQETDLERLQGSREQTEQMQQTNESLLGPEQLPSEEEGFGGEEGAPERGRPGQGVPSEEQEPAIQQDLARKQAQQANQLQANQQMAANAQRAQAEQSATRSIDQSTVQGADQNVKAAQKLWRIVNGVDAITGLEDVLGILTTVAVMNIQMINKLTFKIRFIPPTSFPVEDAAIVGVDMILCTGCLVQCISYCVIPAAVAGALLTILKEAFGMH